MDKDKGRPGVDAETPNRAWDSGRREPRRESLRFWRVGWGRGLQRLFTEGLGWQETLKVTELVETLGSNLERGGPVQRAALLGVSFLPSRGAPPSEARVKVRTGLWASILAVGGSRRRKSPREVAARKKWGTGPRLWLSTRAPVSVA